MRKIIALSTHELNIFRAIGEYGYSPLHSSKPGRCTINDTHFNSKSLINHQLIIDYLSLRKKINDYLTYSTKKENEIALLNHIKKELTKALGRYVMQSVGLTFATLAILSLFPTLLLAKELSLTFVFLGIFSFSFFAFFTLYGFIPLTLMHFKMITPTPYTPAAQDPNTYASLIQDESYFKGFFTQAAGNQTGNDEEKSISLCNVFKS
jgi:hypothetical protein